MNMVVALIRGYSMVIESVLKKEGHMRKVTY